MGRINRRKHISDHQKVVKRERSQQFFERKKIERLNTHNIAAQGNVPLCSEKDYQNTV